MANAGTGILASLVLSVAACTGAPTNAVTGGDDACTAASDKVSELRQLSTDHIAQCEVVAGPDYPRDYFILALRAHCREDLCGSTLMGWFAVEKATGAVFEWNVAEGRRGPEVSG